MIYTYIYIHCEYVLNDFIDRGIWSKKVEATARHCQRSRIFTLLKANSVLDGTGVVLWRPMFWQRKTMENFILKRFCIFILFAFCFLETFTSFLMRSALWYWKEWNSSSFYFITFPDQRLGHQWPILAYQKNIKCETKHFHRASARRIYFAFSLSFFGCTASGIPIPHQGLNLCPLQWKNRVLNTDPPGKSHTWSFFLTQWSSNVLMTYF